MGGADNEYGPDHQCYTQGLSTSIKQSNRNPARIEIAGFFKNSNVWMMDNAIDRYCFIKNVKTENAKKMFAQAIFHFAYAEGKHGGELYEELRNQADILFAEMKAQNDKETVKLYENLLPKFAK